jgi:hypothetical protein
MQKQIQLFGVFVCMFLVLPTSSFSADFIVNNAGSYPDNNPGDGICDTFLAGSHCTFQAAIDEANARSGADTITFSQAYNYGAGLSGFVITDAHLTIDASSVWNQALDRPGVQLSCGPSYSPAVTIGGDQVGDLDDGNFTTIKGLLFSGSCIGIHLKYGYGHVIGGTAGGERNVFINATEPSLLLQYANDPSGS